MSINIGDATFDFLANTTELDLAFARVVEQAKVSAVETGAAFDGIGGAVAASSTSVDGWNETIMEATGKTAELSAGTTVAAGSMRGMSEEARVAEEMIGVRLPRGVNSFMATIPGLEGVIKAAFSAGIVYFFAEALINVSEKLSDFVAKTFIYTQAMKDSDASTAKANQSLLAHAEAIEAATKSLEEYGNTASQKTQTAIDANNNLWAQNTAKIRLNREESEKLKTEQSGVATALGETKTSVLNSILSWSAWSLGLDENTYRFKDNTKAIQKNDAAYVELMKSQQQLALQLKVLDLQLRDEEDLARKATLAKQEAFNQAKIGGAQIVGSALLALQKAQAEALVSFDDGAAVKRLMIDKTFAEAEYQLTLSTHKQKLTAAQQAEAQLYQIEQANLANLVNVQKTMGAEGIKAAEATQVRIVELAKSHNLQLKTEAARGNAEVEALEKQHEAKLINDATKFENEFQQIMKAAFAPGSSRGLGAGLGQEIDLFQKLADAAAKLGVTLESSLVKSSADAKKAVDVMSQGYKANKVTIDDLNRSKLAYVKTLIAEAQATGKSTVELKKEEVELKKLIPSVKEAAKVHADLREMIKSTDADFNNWVFAMASGSESIAASAKKLAEALISTLEKYAEKKGAEALAEGFSQMAVGDPKASISFEAAGLWFALAAAGAAVGGAMSGSGGSKGGASSSSPAMSTGPATQAATGGGQGPNVPHLASGGLITGPTLAMLGENSGRGAVIPLDNGAALNAIAEAIAKHTGAGGGGTNFYIKGMVSGDTVGKLARKISRQVQTGRARLTASNTHKITRRA